MSKKNPSAPSKAASHAKASDAAETAPHHEPHPEPFPDTASDSHHASHPDVASPDFDRANDRMKLASKPNDGLPLAHRDRLKGAGRKG